MLPAVRPSFVALEIEACQLHAQVMQATLATDSNHAILRVLFAVRRRLASLEIEDRLSFAGVM